MDSLGIERVHSLALAAAATALFTGLAAHNAKALQTGMVLLLSLPLARLITTISAQYRAGHRLVAASGAAVLAILLLSLRSLS